MRYEYTGCIRDDDVKNAIIPDIECELEIQFELSGGVPEITIMGVYIESMNLLTSTATLRSIGREIVQQAEADDDLNDLILETEGVVYRGDGGNDPDGRYVWERSPSPSLPIQGAYDARQMGVATGRSR